MMDETGPQLTDDASDTATDAGSDGLPLVAAPSLVAQTWYVLNKAAQRARELVEEALQPFGLRRRHYATLGVVGCDGPLSQQELSGRVPVDRASLVALVDDLERLGLARRQADPTDRRAYLVVLTPEGERVLAEADRKVAEAERRALAPLTADERRQLDLLVRRLCGWGPRAT